MAEGKTLWVQRLGDSCAQSHSCVDIVWAVPVHVSMCGETEVDVVWAFSVWVVLPWVTPGKASNTITWWTGVAGEKYSLRYLNTRVSETQIGCNYPNNVSACRESMKTHSVCVCTCGVHTTSAFLAAHQLTAFLTALGLRDLLPLLLHQRSGCREQILPGRAASVLANPNRSRCPTPNTQGSK